MKLAFLPKVASPHTDLVSAVGWNFVGEVYSCSDDHTIWKWNRNGKALCKVFTNEETSFTDLQWYPSISQRHNAGPRSETFVVGCTDGSFHLISKGGREEKRVEAHEGAVICLRWNFEGTALATGGEDGIVKIWSQSGMHRSTLATTGYSIYAIAWGPDSDQVLFTHGTALVIRPIQSASKQVEWEAHESLVLTLDWNPVNDCIISAGEDCRYKVWDCYGRLLYKSSKFDYSISSVAWCPSGELFAVASFGTLLLCDKSGWLYSKEKLDTGLIQRLAWSTDGTQIAGAAGNGFVIFGELVARQIEWERIITTLVDSNRLLVQDVLNETVEELDFRDRIIKMSLNSNHLVVATATQCCIYSTSNWNTPHIFDIKDAIILLKLSQRYFLTVDAFTGLQLFNYEGRHLSNPKYQGLCPEALNDQNVSISDDILAITDHSDHKTVRFLDASKGKVVGEEVHHTLEIMVISLSQMRTSADRKLVLIDRNQDLYITPIFNVALCKLGTMIDDALWNDSIDILAAVSSQKLVVWYYPHAAYFDKDLLKYVKLTKECLVGESAKIQSFHGSRCTVRRKDGARIFTDVSPYSFLLFEHVVTKQWDQAIRLCRYVKDDLLWACLAAMAVDSKDLNTAEVAYAALNEVDKVHYMLHVKDLPSEDARQAELALFKRRPEEAESILLQAGLICRAIKMHTRLFNWDRALELALLHKQHLDTVLWLRQQYLKSARVEETKQQFLHLNQQILRCRYKLICRKSLPRLKKRKKGRVIANQLYSPSAASKHAISVAALVDIRWANTSWFMRFLWLKDLSQPNDNHLECAVHVVEAEIAFSTYAKKQRLNYVDYELKDL